MLVELNFSMPLVALEELMQVAGIFDPTLMIEHELMDLEIQVCYSHLLRPMQAKTALLTLGCSFGLPLLPCCLLFVGTAQAELDEPDDQLAALWALNLEQEREYKAKVDTPPGGPRFQKFMEEFQVRPDHSAPLAPSHMSAPAERGGGRANRRRRCFHACAQNEQQGLAAEGAAGRSTRAPRIHMRSKM